MKDKVRGKEIRKRTKVGDIIENIPRENGGELVMWRGRAMADGRKR